MGARSFVHTIEAENASKAFEALVEDAHYNNGHDRYNGTISTCSIGRCSKRFDVYSKKNEKLAMKIIEDDDNGEKYVARYIDLGVCGYVKTTVKKTVKQYTAKYKQQFCVINNETGHLVNKNAHFDKKGDADKEAIKCVQNGMWVSVIKDMVKLSGNNTVTEFEVETKKVSKPKKLDSSVKVMHKYIFYGYGAE